MSMNDDEIDDKLDELDLKALLVKQCHELAEIRYQLQLLNGAQEDIEHPDIVTCKPCDMEIPETEKKKHARENHNWTKSLGEGSLERLYERS